MYYIYIYMYTYMYIYTYISKHGIGPPAGLWTSEPSPSTAPAPSAPTRSALHPTPYTLHPTPYTLPPTL